MAPASPSNVVARMAAGEIWSTVFNHVKESIFFIIVAPKVQRMKDILNQAAKVRTVDKRKEREERCHQSRNSTGFVVRNRNNRLLILTCAHVIEHVYKGSSTISAEEADDWFEVTVLCDHYECGFRSAGLAKLDADKRVYARGTIIAIDCPRDLLLIEVEEKEIKHWSSKEMCGENHPAIEISQNLPTTGSDTLLFSWPPHKHRTIAGGVLGVQRMVQEISRPNIVEYDMQIVEAHITSEEGSSGAPLLSTSGEVIGLLHGGFKGTHSYFIPPDLIRSFLASVGTTSDVPFAASRRELLSAGHVSA